MKNYEQQAQDFLTKTGTTIVFKFWKHARYFYDDTQSRDIYKVTLKNFTHKFTLSFGQSIVETGKCPTAYDVLACIQKYDVGSIENFCDEFGYSLYNEYTGRKDQKVQRLYDAVCKEYENIDKMFTSEEIELLQEIN